MDFVSYCCKSTKLHRFSPDFGIETAVLQHLLRQILGHAADPGAEGVHQGLAPLVEGGPDHPEEKLLVRNGEGGRGAAGQARLL